ncbi:hypothetical protein IKJ53_04605 [bacterium]|nr:hypothetical protein [bacterium]
MKRILLLLSFIVLSAFSSVNADQYVLACKINIRAVKQHTNEILRSYVIDRYFIVDTLIEGVFDANNLPLIVHEFTNSQIIFSKRAQSFADIVDTRLVYNRFTRQISLNEIYAYSSKFDQRAKFVTKGEGTCKEIKINRIPLF